jgi:hypothetical protein
MNNRGQDLYLVATFPQQTSLFEDNALSASRVKESHVDDIDLQSSRSLDPGFQSRID